MSLTLPPSWIQAGKFKGDKYDKISEIISRVNSIASGEGILNIVSTSTSGTIATISSTVTLAGALTGIHLDLDGLTLNGQGLTGLRVRLPTTYGTGSENAVHVSGDGRTLLLCTDSWAIYTTSEGYFGNLNINHLSLRSNTDVGNYDFQARTFYADTAGSIFKDVITIGNTKEFTGVKSCADNTITPFVRLACTGGYQNGSDQTLFVKLYLVCEWGDAYCASAAEYTIYSRDAYESGGPPYWPGQTSVQLVNRVDLGSINAGFADIGLPTVTATWNATNAYMEIRVQADLTGVGGGGSSYSARYKIHVLAGKIDKVAITAL